MVPTDQQLMTGEQHLRSHDQQQMGIRLQRPPSTGLAPDLHVSDSSVGLLVIGSAY